jgi:hypothetical protein
MEIEAGVNMENLIIIGQAGVKLISIWWPVILFGIVGMIWADKQVEHLKENR